MALMALIWPLINPGAVYWCSFLNALNMFEEPCLVPGSLSLLTAFK